MAELAWVDFIRLHPAAHLVTASVVPPRTGNHLARLRRRLNQLIREQAPVGDVATAIVRLTGIAEIHCGFAAKADADRLAWLVKARAPRRPPEAAAGGWLTHRTFVLGATKEVALAGLLATPDESRRPS
jgi:hypothetical protein